MSCWTDPQCLLFIGSALLATCAIAVSFWFSFCVHQTVILIIIMFLVFLQIFIAVKAITTPLPKIVRYEDEKYYSDPVSKTKQPFPSINDSPRIALSVIVPAYEEEQRCEFIINILTSIHHQHLQLLFSFYRSFCFRSFCFLVPKMLDEALEYLENRSKKDATFQYELIVVSDGSKDSTVQVALEYSKKYTTDKVRVLNLIKNRGKGGAVRMVCAIQREYNPNKITLFQFE